MKKPVVYNNQPIAVDLEEGKAYPYCRCGKSATQPFCDGSHAGSGLQPLAFTAEASGEAWLCQCKQTGNAPYCDGAHKQFKSGDIGKEAP